jgi:hypothetical protein
VTLFDGLLVAAIAALAGVVVAEVVKMRRTARAAPPPAVVRASSAPAPDTSEWCPLPGGTTLELGATGFSIELNTRRSGYLYRLWSPEGRPLYDSHDLVALKNAGQRLAAERNEFACAVLPRIPH